MTLLEETPAVKPGSPFIGLQHNPYTGKWALDRPDLVRDDIKGHYRRSRAGLLLPDVRQEPWQPKLLAWLRDNVNRKIPHWYYKALLGHDLHISAYAALHLRYFHALRQDPLTGEYRQCVTQAWLFLNAKHASVRSHV